MGSAKLLLAPPPRFEIRPNDRLSIMGDSLTEAEISRWSSYLEERLLLRYGAAKPVITYRAKAGERFPYALATLLPQVISDNPTALIFQIGPTNSYGHTTVAANIYQDALALYTAARAAMPNVRMCQMSTFAPHSELWNNGLSPDFREQYLVEDAIKQACIVAGIPFVDVGAGQRSYNQQYNVPAPGVTPVLQPDGFLYLPHGLQTNDGTHVSGGRGAALMSQAFEAAITLVDTTYPDLPVDYLPTTDLAPELWLRADSIAGNPGDPVTTWANEGSAGGAFAPTTPGCAVIANYAGSTPYDFESRNVVALDGIGALSSAIGGIAGPKTVWAMYRIRTFATPAAPRGTLLAIKGAPHWTELIPSWSGGTFSFQSEMKRDASDGFFSVYTNDLSHPLSDGTYMMKPTRACCTYLGGSSTLAASYEYDINSRLAGIGRVGVWLNHDAADLSSIGGCVTSTGFVHRACAIDAAEIFIATGSVSALVKARNNQYLTRKWGPLL